MGTWLPVRPHAYLRSGPFKRSDGAASTYWRWQLFLPDVYDPTVWIGTAIFVGSLFACSSLLRPLYRIWWKHHRSWIALEGGAVAGSLAGAFAAATGPFRLPIPVKPSDWSGWPLDVVQCFVVLLLWSNLYFSIRQYAHSLAERERLIVAESEARRARLVALRYQLNPHFLFNSLNAVSTLILEGDTVGANQMLTRICCLLRDTLQIDPALETSLKAEIAHAQQYLSIEQVRMGDRLRFVCDVGEGLDAALVPGMLLQPLIENAVRYGIVHSERSGEVRIRASRDRDGLRITIENTGSQSVEESNGHGIGLANTRERLATLYGSDHDFEVNGLEEGGCRVSLRVPLRFAPGTAPCAS